LSLRWLILYVFILFTLTYRVQQFLQEIVKKAIGFYATDIITLLTGQILPKLPCRLVGDLASFWLGEDFYPGWDITGITVITDFMCPSLNRDRLFVLLLFTREKIVHTYTCCRTLYSFLTKRPEQRKYFFSQVRIKILQLYFRKVLVQVSITLQID
jgi:hypothetical protein